MLKKKRYDIIRLSKKIVIQNEKRNSNIRGGTNGRKELNEIIDYELVKDKLNIEKEKSIKYLRGGICKD